MFKIILKNRKTNKVVRLYIRHYIFTDGIILCALLDSNTDKNTKQYQTNEWSILSCTKEF